MGERFDLVLSLLSWGLHYPISTYLGEVHVALSKRGVSIVDVRLKSDGESELRRAFREVELIAEGNKYRRVVARRPRETVNEAS